MAVNVDQERNAKYSDDCSLTVLLQPNQMSSKQVRLFEAARKNDLESLEKALSDHVQVNTRNNLDRTAMHWAAANGNGEAIDVLTRASANVNCADKYGMTPVLLAAWYGHIGAMEALTKNKKTILNCYNKQGMNVVHCAAHNDNVNILEFFNVNQMTSKLDVNKQDLRGRTAIVLAAEKGFAETVDYLLTIGCDPSIADQNGNTALHMAAKCGDDEIVESLLRQSKEGVNLVDNEGLTALHIAAASGHTDIVYLLQGVSADINAQTNKGMTPLMLAASGGHDEAVSLLLEESCCDMECKNNEGHSAVHLATLKNSVRVLRLLISKGCDVNTVNKMGETALHIAAEKGYLQCVQLLLDSGCHLTTKDISGKMALTLASRANCVAAVDLIIKAERIHTILRNSQQVGERVGYTQKGVQDVRMIRNDDEVEDLEEGKDPQRREVATDGGAGNGEEDGSESTRPPDSTNGDDDSPLDSPHRRPAEISDGAQKRVPYNDEKEEDEDDEVFQVEDLLGQGGGWRGGDGDGSSMAVGGAGSSSDEYGAAMKTILWKLATKSLRPGEWKKLANAWQFSDHHLRAIEHQYTGKNSHCGHSYRMMAIWLDCYLALNPPPFGNPLRELYDGLVTIGRQKLAEKIRSKCNRKSEARKSCIIS